MEWERTCKRNLEKSKAIYLEVLCQKRIWSNYWIFQSNKEYNHKTLTYNIMQLSMMMIIIRMQDFGEPKRKNERNDIQDNMMKEKQRRKVGKTSTPHTIRIISIFCSRPPFGIVVVLFRVFVLLCAVCSLQSGAARVS